MVRIPMMLNDYIAMTFALELTSIDSRLAGSDFTVSKELVIKCMEMHGYDDIAYPNYTSYGISLPRFGGKRKTMRRKK